MANAFCVKNHFVSIFVRSFAIRKENELHRMDCFAPPGLNVGKLSGNA